MWAGVFVAVSVAVTAVVVAWFFLTARHLAKVASGWDERPDTPAERFYGPHPFAPAGPDAESQRPEDTGNAWDPPPPTSTGRRRGARRQRR